jgi:hypothetical protein
LPFSRGEPHPADRQPWGLTELISLHKVKLIPHQRIGNYDEGCL